MFLVNSRSGLVSATPSGLGREVHHPTGAFLLPKLRNHFAEFLNQSYLKRLGILCPTTCVGLRYGQQMCSLRSFSRKRGITYFMARRPRHHPSALAVVRIFLHHLPTGLNRDFQHPARLPFSVPPSVERTSTGTGILTRFPSPTAFALGLGAD